MATDLGPVNVSASDDRTYRFIQLDNGLLALLIHGDDEDKAAAAVSVSVGSLSDPPELQGLAHFLEHMLFLGTAKYPNEDEYSAFIESHGGSQNAYTSDSCTNYYFVVSHEYLRPALDRFAQFFISPLFDASCTERELNAVHSEHEKNLKQDAWRFHQLNRHTCDPAHPYHHFSTGSKDTLHTAPQAAGIDVRQALLDFHARHYSSNMMSLVLIGRESLDQLQELAIEMFSGVPNTNAQPMPPPGQPLGPAQTGKRFKVIPVRQARSLQLQFQVPDDTAHFRAQPGHYLSHLVGHEGPGSLLSFLKSKDWATELMSGFSTGFKDDFAFFTVTIELTEAGLAAADDIVCAYFQYVTMLRACGVQKWIFDECAQLRALAFRYKDKVRADSYCSSLARVLRDYPPQHVLDHPYAMDDWRPDLIAAVLEQLRPENLRLWIRTQGELPGALTEPYYGTQYTEEPLTPAQLEAWARAPPEPALSMPPPNEFIPTDLTLRVHPAPPAVPALLREDARGKVWYKPDTRFSRPRAVIKVALVTPLAEADPTFAVISRLYVDLLKESLAEYAYAAELASLHYTFDSTRYGIELGVGGYTDKLPVLLARVLERAVALPVDPAKFAAIKEKYKRALMNFKAQEPYMQLTFLTSMVLSERCYAQHERLVELEALTPEHLTATMPLLLSRMFTETLVLGNMTAAEALVVDDVIKSAFAGSTLSYLACVHSLPSPDCQPRATAGRSHRLNAPFLCGSTSCPWGRTMLTPRRPRSTRRRPWPFTFRSVPRRSHSKHGSRSSARSSRARALPSCAQRSSLDISSTAVLAAPAARFTCSSLCSPLPCRLCLTSAFSPSLRPSRRCSPT
eukprot:m.70194 g.70194  ORF g.70194 m.70194 type:complete len:850 (+) comp7579_c0_seq2:7-2556(+)